jgi:VIT1/CCC1 family predicted Fe2+/Mn2+ transporter
MESVLASLIVTLIFLIVTGIAGHRLEKRPKPYGWVWPVIHIVLFAFVLSGVMASAYKLQALPDASHYARIALYAAGLSVMTNFVVGVAMLIIKRKNRKLIKTHKYSTYVMAASLIAAIIFVTVQP